MNAENTNPASTPTANPKHSPKPPPNHSKPKPECERTPNVAIGHIRVAFR
jgi:hypothetical protein